MIEESRLKQLTNSKAKATMDVVQRSLLHAGLPCGIVAMHGRRHRKPTYG